jgi:8-oxo-dGTP diphosphatase
MSALPDEPPRGPEHECVGAIIVRGESILLGKRSAERSFYPDVWDVFGGHVEAGESYEQTLRRELREELGILPIACQYLETWHEPDRTEGAALACHFYIVTEWRGTPKNVAPQEHSEINWYHFEEVAQLKLAHPKYVHIFQNARLLLEQCGDTNRNND